MTVTDGSLNDARVRLFEIVLKDICKFDAKDMMIGSLLREIENWKLRSKIKNYNFFW